MEHSGNTPGESAVLSAALDGARSAAFVGRRAEVVLFEDMLAGGVPTKVLCLHGPGGIGKSMLLAVLAALARARGRSTHLLDAREVAPTPESVRQAASPPGSMPDVLLVDGVELLVDLEPWLWREFLAARPADSLTVLASRRAPDHRWRWDPGWGRLVAVRELGALDPGESEELLAARGVAADVRAHLARIGRGHPLVLSLLAEAGTRARAPETLSQAPDLVSTLCAVLVDDVPDDAHRTGLAVVAHAHRATLDLLEAVVGGSARPVWAWLESRPYACPGQVGLYLHDVVREVFDAEFARRSPEAYGSLHRAVRGYFVGRMVDPLEARPDRAAAEILMMHRVGPLAAETEMLRSSNVPAVRGGRAGDVAATVQLIETAEGAAAAELAERHLALCPHGLHRVRSPEGVEAFAVHCYLPTRTALDDDDPVAAAILDAVAARGPLRPGERINVNRFGTGARHVRDPLVLLVNGVSCLLEWSRRPAAWSFLVTIDDDHYGPYFSHLGMERMVSVRTGGPPGAPVTSVAYGWDRRRFPPRDMFELMASRELSGSVGPPDPELLRPRPLGEDEFAAEVRSALVRLRQPDRLAGSALLGTALVGSRESDPVAALRTALAEAIEALGAEADGDEHRRVLARTYLKGAPTQEAAAEVLGLPFSTYRRHLSLAQQRLVEVLWSVELGQSRIEDGQVMSTE